MVCMQVGRDEKWNVEKNLIINGGAEIEKAQVPMRKDKAQTLLFETGALCLF